MRPLPTAASALALPLLSLALSRAATAAPPALDGTTRDYKQVHLVVRVTPHIEERYVDGETTVRFAPTADTLSALRLHCVETSVLSAAREDGTPLEFKVADGLLTVELGTPVAKGVESAVTVRYRSRPTRGLYFHSPSKESPDTPLEMYSQGEGTDNRRWIPCYDEPDDRSTCELFASVPRALSTISNGVLVEKKALEGGLREDHWKLDRRIPSYLISLIVGKFETVTDRWRDVPLEYNGPVGRAAEIREGYHSTPAIMEFFSAYTERPFPWPRYAQTTVWDFVYGGMENASATTMNMRLLHTADARPNYTPDGLVAHEMAHQWFGDFLTCRTWDHMWLNEGFATYFTDLFFESRDGKDQFAIERWRQNHGYFDGTPHPESLGLTPSPRGDIPLELHGGKEYSRGAAILHQLRIELGDEVFRKGIARYLRENEDRAVVSDDFRRSMEAEAGRSLKWFFDQWVYGAGYPVLAVSFALEQSGGGHVAHVTVDQAQAAGSGQPEAFRITVPYRFGGEDRQATGRLDVRRRHQVFDIDLPAGPVRSWLRAGDGGGTFAKVGLTQDRPAWTRALAEDPDPTGRMEAADALVAWPLEAVAALASSLERDSSYVVRAACAKALGQVGGQAALDALRGPALADKDARVREAVADALAERSRDEAGKTLVDLATKDPSPYVRAAAARGAGRVHADGAFDLLRGLLAVDSHRETIRAGALDGLAALGDRRALDLAKALLPYNWPRGDHFGMRTSALGVLTALAPDEPDTRATIVRLLDDPYHRMRAAAAEAAGKYLVREAAERLKKMAEDDPDGGSKGAAKAALERLSKAGA